MATKLDKTGLAYFYERLKTVFASVTALNALDAKVDAVIAEGGEPNVIEAVKVNGVELTPDTDKAVDILTTEINNDTVIGGGAGVNWVVKDNNNGKLIAFADAQDGLHYQFGATGTPWVLAYKDDVPTNTNQLVNGAGFQNEQQVQALIDAELADITGIDFQVVTELPATGEHGVIYLVSKQGAIGDVYDEYIWITPTSGTAHYEQIGTTAVDLSGYWSKAELVDITTAEIDAIIAGS